MRRQTIARTHDYFEEDLALIDRYALLLNMTKVGIIRHALELLDAKYKDVDPSKVQGVEALFLKKRPEKPATLPRIKPVKSELGRW